MFDVLTYLGHSALCLAALYIIYKAAMSYETLHRLNRVVLLGIVALSALLPLCEIKITEEVEAEWVQANNFYLPDSEVALAVEPAIAEFEPFDYVGLLKSVATVVFLLGVAFMVVRLVMSTLSVCRLIRSGRVERLEDGVTLTVVDNIPSPFSYFGHIVVAESDLAENRDLILEHELAHIRLHHSWDVLAVDLALIVWWFNPALWLLRRELQSLHEYQADDSVLRRGVDAKTYQSLLIKRAVGSRLYSIANCLNHSNLKNRITMMCKKKSSRWSAAKLLFVLPLVALSLAATATTVYVTVDNIDESKVKQKSENNQIQSRIEERTFDTEVVKDDKFALSPAGSERYNLVPAEANVATQQSEKREIKGKVVDEQGKPIGGVFVLIKNKSFGAATSSEGNFGGLKVTDDDYLDISHVGYERQEVAVKGKSSFTITLKTRIYTTETAAEVSSEPAVLKAEVMPKFEGGDLNKFRSWVQMHIKYPKIAQEQVIQGRVIAEFVVEKDGKVSFSKIMESPHESLSAEVEGAIRHSPNWTPGTNGGKPVRVKMQIPVNFAIRNGGKEASIGNIRVISNTKFVYNGETYDQIGIAKALESYNQDKINVHVDSETTISPFLDFILKRIVKEVNYIYLNKFTTVDDKELHSSIIQYYHNNVLRRIRNDECAVGVVYVDITVGRTGVMTIEKISSKCKSAEIGSYLEKKVEFSLKGFPIVSIREKIEEPQSIRLEVAFAKRENGEVFMPDVELGKDALTIIGGEPLSMAKNKPASSNNDEEDQPLIKAEQSPSFQGGDLDDYRSWVESQIEIPKKLQKKFDGGVVTFEFAIESDGSVTFSKILHSPHELLSAEVERVVKSSPKFTPAKQRGESVQVKVQTGVKFVKKKN